jgi:hypothetical protein
VPLLSLEADTSRYFDTHHTHADTPEKLDPFKPARNAAAMAVVAYDLADLPGRLGD